MNNSSFFHILPTVTAVAMSFGSELWSSQSDTQAFFNSYTNIEHRNSKHGPQEATSTISINWYNASRLKDNYLRLLKISSLDNNWDGYGAKPIPKNVIERVKRLLYELPEGAKLFPTSRSSVQLEYHLGENKYFELEVFSDSYFLYWIDKDRSFENRVYKREIKQQLKMFLS